MQKSTPYFFILIVYLSCTFIACTNDELPEPPACDATEVITYDGHIKAILDLSCAYDGCHISGFSSGDFTNYASLDPFLGSSGALADRTITQQDMPPSNVPDGMPEMLTAEQIQLLQCWVDGGYLEN